MPDVRVKVQFDISDLVGTFMDDALQAKIGDTVVDMSKEMIAAGQSPVRGEGRFEEYKGVGDLRAAKESNRRLERLKRGVGKVGKKNAVYKRLEREVRGRKADLEAAKRRIYPYSVQKKFPDKQVRPVNLFLSGEMLANLRWEEGEDDSVRVGVITSDKSIQARADGNQHGHDNVPARPFVPEEGQEYAVSIMNELKRLFSERISDIINRSNR